jgi:hypothetical protein
MQRCRRPGSIEFRKDEDGVRTALKRRIEARHKAEGGIDRIRKRTFDQVASRDGTVTHTTEWA